jgi:hypothetical protein
LFPRLIEAQAPLDCKERRGCDADPFPDVGKEKKNREKERKQGKIGWAFISS